MNVGIYIYHNVEVLDFAGPYEVFTTAARLKKRQDADLPNLFEVFLIAERLDLVSARANFKVKPHFTIQDHPNVDILIIPGGVHVHEMEKPGIISWISKLSQDTQLTASVCTGAFLLAKANVLNGLACTTHWEDIPELRTSFPSLDVREEVPWVDNGHIITSAGISAGIEMAYHLITRLVGKEMALKTARQMQYDWNNAELSIEKE
ncbi:MAG: DJ-1/PfpI family protein [Anaerolineae bacterium]|nr:DJ-1/PfpI family protein [Anaerolineae bacterium]MDK1081554.1 DJ-1/PfpI family protein [Anaerolineae bacterium]MDK1117759.1 DJ-1/PfpI family protein [Anaerolineae bacterium]